MKQILQGLTALILLCLHVAAILAEDWPAYRKDASRSGYTKEEIPNQLTLRWVFKSHAPPQPAWVMSERLEFDSVFQPIILGETAYWGSSVDNQLYAVDLKTGKIRWTFFTQAPIRFAPVGWKQSLFVVSDDGWLYAIAADTGKLLWKYRGGPNDRQIFGNDRLISRWPARGAAVVFDDTVYFAAGIWQSDGVFIHALDAETGQRIWTNDKSAALEMPQPHGGANAKSGVSAQGYLLADSDQLYIPAGRSVPAVFQRKTGELGYYHLQKNQQRGGCFAVLADQFFYNAGCLFDKKTGVLASRIGNGKIVSLPTELVRAEGKSLVRYRWVDRKTKDRKGKTVSVREPQNIRLIDGKQEVLEFIIAGSNAIRGEANRVSAVDYTRQRNTWWSHEVEGNALGLAYGNGRLLVSTDQGLIYCFDGDEENDEPTLVQIRRQAPALPEQIQQAADEILKKTGLEEGYCVDLECETGELAIALALKSNLQIYAVSSDPRKVEAARKKINSAGLYGTRITVVQSDLSKKLLPKQCADLVVSQQSLTNKPNPELSSEQHRLQRPYGGMICTGPAGAMKLETRGALAGAGSWTHMYANAANTVCSADELVSGPLEMSWFRDVDFELPNRHGRGPAPLSHRGVLVVGGVDGICALNAYNGRTLWIYDQKNYLRDFDGIHHDVASPEVGNHFCLGEDSLFLRLKDKCIQLDLKTGKKRAEFTTPAKPDDKNRAWGYLAYHQGLLFGTIANEQHKVSPRYKLSKLYPESTKLFAFDIKSKQLKWSYPAKKSIRNNTIAIGTDSVYLIDRPIVMQDRIDNPRRNGRPAPKMKPGELPEGLLISLDINTGDIRWEKKKEIFGTQLSVSNEFGVLLMSYLGQNHKFFSLPSEAGGRLAALDAQTGERLWDVKAEYKTRPLIIDSTVYTQKAAWNLYSGEEIPFQLNRSYGCGQLSAGKNMMLFRSATLGYLDLNRDKGVENYGGIRLGCWINAIPAGGLVLVPDGSAKCKCSYQMKAWFALQKAEQE